MITPEHKTLDVIEYMEIMNEIDWDTLTYAEKNRELYLKQKELLGMFLKRGAISRTQYDKSLHDLIEKTGYQLPEHEKR